MGLLSEQHLQAWLVPDGGSFRARVEQQALPGVLVTQRHPRVPQPERREVQRRQRGGRGRALRQAPQLLNCPVQRAALAVQRAPGALAQLSRMLGMCTGTPSPDRSRQAMTALTLWDSILTSNAWTIEARD